MVIIDNKLILVISKIVIRVLGAYKEKVLNLMTKKICLLKVPSFKCTFN